MTPVSERHPHRIVVVHPYDPRLGSARSPEQKLEEACGLVRAIGLTVAQGLFLSLGEKRAATLVSRGGVERIAAALADSEAGLALMNCALTGVQQRNLERAWGCKVLDRTGLILEIFGARARTSEGRLQVALAAMRYARSRLVQSWSHLERQRGALGAVGGPGESQIEIDRRLIGRRIASLTQRLETVRRTRGLQRASRRRVPYPVVALVGYTNAGKSTLFNRLTGAAALVRDMPFATLDPAMRALSLPSGRPVIVSDTVGFIADLPTELVAAFRATLEEVTAADVILHVRDAASAESRAQRQDVLSVLGDLLPAESQTPVIEVLNKSDLLSPNAALALRQGPALDMPEAPLLVSALEGRGIEALLERLDAAFAVGDLRIVETIPHAEGRRLAWLHRHGRVLERCSTEEGVVLTVTLPPPLLGRYRSLFTLLATQEQA